MFPVSSRRGLLGCLSSFVILAGCNTSADDTVSAKVEVINHASSALTASGITAINGIYSGDCSGHSNNETWSVAVSGSPTLANAPLSVRKNDNDCDLTITEIVVDDGTFAATPNLSLATSFAGSGSAFKDDPEAAVDFYGNAKISSLSFSGDFTIDVVVSDDPNDANTGSKQGAFATQSSTVSATNVPAPNYTIGLSSFTLLTDVNDEVSSVAGYAQLTAGSATGQTYAIVGGTLTSAATPEDLATAYGGATVSGTLAGLTSLRLPAGSFGLVGDDLTDGPATRTVIIRNTSNGVISYQLIAVAFNKP